MKYQVIKAFKDVGDKTRNVGDIIEVDNNRAAKLRRYGLIGGAVEQAVIQIEKPLEQVEEKAIIEVEEKAVKPKPLKKKTR